MTTDRHRQTEPGRVTRSSAWLLIAFAGLIGFVILTALVMSQVALPFDEPLLAWARSLDGWDAGWRILSETANLPLVVIGIGMVVWLAATKRRREALIVLVMLAAVTAGSEGVKELVARPRPSGTDPTIPGVVYSYPSGHVLEALVIVGIITIRRWRSSWPLAARVWTVVAVVVWVLAVGVARMAVNSHYPSDVLAGLLGGCAALGIYGWLTWDAGAADRQPTRPERGAVLLRESEGA